MIYDNKRYRVHNNYLTVGAGVLSSSIRNESQNVLGMDFQFHIRTHQFQAGAMMSGPAFGDNNNINGHIGYGYRRERQFTNIAAFIGPSYNYGVEGIYPDPETYYSIYGGYACIQFVTKISFDIGIGVEGFADISQKQQLYGFKIVAFFSGAYRGPKRNYNPNVRSEKPR